jgi:hypothetical protein
MTLDPVTALTLAKFAQNKNATHFKADLAAGSYPVDLTVSLLGTLTRGIPGVTTRRNDSGSRHIVRYLLDRLNDLEFSVLHRDLADIRKGNFEVKFPHQYDNRLNKIMPYRDIPRQGNTRFDGELIVENVPEEPTAYSDVVTGLNIVQNQ